MTTYTTKAGETFEDISRKEYGTEENTPTIRKANPSAGATLDEGTQLFIPKTPVKSKINPTLDEVTLLIGGLEFKNFLEILVSQRFDSFDTCDITAPFEPENTQFRKLFKPFSYQDIEVFIGEELVFSGTQMGVNPNVTAQSRTVTLSAYSRCAVINDTCVPISAYPVEVRGFKLDRIAKSVTETFPFDVVVNADMGASFSVATIKPEKRIAPYLTELAKQRDIVLTNNLEGNLLLTKATESESVAYLKDNQPPLLSVIPSFSEQSYYSDYTAILPVIIRQNPTSYTAKNRKLTNALRVDNYMATDSFNGDEKTVAESRRARGLANSISYTCQLATLRDPNNALYAVNTFVNIEAPNAMIYRDTKMFVRGVTMSLTSSARVCELELTLPEAYNGKEVEVVPWEE
ncbi:hypothetical protein NVP1174O_27 [Vibrio phage 1.174.O._10N.261.55.A8]|nr:hypothetical protein NVP1174O_27 [Vibrio phage 1.174.O._10N.261.55.A8]